MQIVRTFKNLNLILTMFLLYLDYISIL